MNQDLTFMGNQFDEILEIIDNARTRAMRAVNAELINMYWEIGAYISQKVEADGWGKSVVTDSHTTGIVIDIGYAHAQPVLLVTNSNQGFGIFANSHATVLPGRMVNTLRSHPSYDIRIRRCQICRC